MKLCSDRETLDELVATAADRGRWPKAHALFDKIRQKTLRVDRERNSASGTQYTFEEICAKTLIVTTRGSGRRLRAAAERVIVGRTSDGGRLGTAGCGR